jgi:DDE superfamily endonuclease
MLALRLFLPESSTRNRARLERAGVPAEYRAARTKPEMALTEIDRIIAAGVRFGCVLADAEYGLSAPFRQGLTARNLTWAAAPQGLPRRCADNLAGAKRGREELGLDHQRHVPDILSIPAEDDAGPARIGPRSADESCWFSSRRSAAQTLLDRMPNLALMCMAFTSTMHYALPHHCST